VRAHAADYIIRRSQPTRARARPVPKRVAR
jgi:hypothetical protein